MASPDDKSKPPSERSSADNQPTAPLGRSEPVAHPADSSHTPAHPRALEQRYEILSEAGHGGMGIVYRARDRETGEIVALKVLKPEIAADAAIIERFKNELRLARKITHKNVSRIHEFNRAPDGSAYISMEYVDGDSLRRVLNRFGAMGLRTGLRIAQQVSEGLHEAHAQGVVHRDLKPENIMLDQAGNVKVMDFGIARSLESSSATTGILGTPTYMAPEQAEGKLVDARTDIYALGLIFYEMFTGSMAFSGDTPAAVMYKHVHHTPASPRELEAGIPAHIERAILKCLEKNPAKRYQSVDELSEALTQKPELTPAPSEGAGEAIALPLRLSAWQRSDWVLLAAAAVALALFFPLFYRFHPASAMEITVNDEEQKQIARELFKKINWNVEIGKSSMHLNPDGYYHIAANAGDPIARRLMTRLRAGGGWWHAEMKVEFPGGKAVNGDYAETTKGRVVGASLWPTDSPSELGAQPDDGAIAQMRELARTALTTMFGPEAVTGAYSERRGMNWRWYFAWVRPLEPNGVYERYNASLGGRQIASLSCDAVTWQVPGWTYDYDAFAPPSRYFVSVTFMLLLALGLFLSRKVYQESPSRSGLCVAALVAAAFTWTAFGIQMRAGAFTGPGGDVSKVLVPLLMFCIIFLVTYAVLKTVQYYMRSRFPAYAASYAMLFSKRALESRVGLGVLRGLLAGAAFCGLWMAVISIAGVWGKGLAGMLFWVGVDSDLYQVLRPFGMGALNWSSPGLRTILPTGLFIEVLLAGWLLVALPLSLLRKATPRSRVLLAALAGLWVALGFSLAGPMAFPQTAYYVLVAAQAVFLGAVFLKYGLVSTLSAIFTVETILLAFPLLEIFGHIDPLPYAIPVALWCILLALAVAIFFRSQLVLAYRRTAAVFE